MKVKIGYSQKGPTGCIESLCQASAEQQEREGGKFACKHSQTITKVITGNAIKADVANRLTLPSARAVQLLVSLGSSCGHKLSWVPPGQGLPALLPACPGGPSVLSLSGSAPEQAQHGEGTGGSCYNPNGTDCSFGLQRGSKTQAGNMMRFDFFFYPQAH